MYRFIRPSFSILACMLLVGLSIAGCEGTTTPTTNSTNIMTLKVAQISSSVAFFPLYIAEQESFFKKQGLTLDPANPPQLGDGAKVGAALESGSIDVAGGGVITDAFTLSKVDAHVRILGALTTGYYVDVTASKQFEQTAHLTANSSLADKVKALVGKKIGITAPGSGTEALMIYLFRIYGYDSKRDATLVNLGGTTTAAIAALKTGRVDAISFFSPAGQVAEAQGIGNILISPDRGDIPSMQGQVHGVFYTRQQVIDAKPKAVEAFIRGIAQAEAYIHQNAAQMPSLLSKYLKLDQKTTTTVWQATLPIVPTTPLISQDGYNKATQFHVKAGLIAIALAYKDVVADGTMQDALKGLSSSS